MSLVAGVLLGGCNLVVPMHPGLWAFGSVVEAGTGTPLVGARISVFGTSIESGAGGCFRLALADAPPFEFDVAHSGHKPAVSTPPRGQFRVDVALAPADGKQASVVTWTDSTQREFVAAPRCR